MRERVCTAQRCTVTGEQVTGRDSEHGTRSRKRKVSAADFPPGLNEKEAGFRFLSLVDVDSQDKIYTL